MCGHDHLFVDFIPFDPSHAPRRDGKKPDSSSLGDDRTELRSVVPRAQVVGISGGDIPGQVGRMGSDLRIATSNDLYRLLDVREGHHLHATARRLHVPVPGGVDCHIRPCRRVIDPAGCNA